MTDVFTYGGYGLLRLGMTSTELAWQDLIRPVRDDPCMPYAAAGRYSDQGLQVQFGEGDALVSVATNTPGPQTWQGARVGMTWGQVQQRHPDAHIVQKLGNGGPFYAAQTRGEGAMIMFFAVSEPDPYNWYGGTMMGHPDWPRSQQITAIELMPYSDEVFGGC